MKIGIGARPIGIGEAFTAIANDSNSIYWNPAGLGFQIKAQTSFTHISSFADTNYEFLSFNTPIGKNSNIGFSLAYFSYGTLPGWDEYGNTSKEFTAGDILTGISFGHRTSERFALGITVKLINSWISDYSASILASDIGSLYKISDNFSTAINIQNIGFGKLTFNTEGDTLPLNFKIGIAYKPTNYLLFPADLNITTDKTLNFGFGGEYTYHSIFDFSLRTGYKISSAYKNNLLTIGFGIGYFNYNVDYVFIPAGELGTAHRISFIMVF
jgi:hypothetical protein